MPISDSEYDALAYAVSQGKIVYYSGRSASTLDELDSIVSMAETATTHSDTPDPFPAGALPAGWTPEMADTLADRIVARLIQRQDKSAAGVASPDDSEAVDPSLPPSPLNSLPVATLRDMASGYGIDTAGAKKSDLIRAIEAKQAEAAPANDSTVPAEGATV